MHAASGWFVWFNLTLENGLKPVLNSNEYFNFPFGITSNEEKLGCRSSGFSDLNKALKFLKKIHPIFYEEVSLEVIKTWQNNIHTFLGKNTNIGWLGISVTKCSVKLKNWVNLKNVMQLTEQIFIEKNFPTTRQQNGESALVRSTSFSARLWRRRNAFETEICSTFSALSSQIISVSFRAILKLKGRNTDNAKRVNVRSYLCLNSFYCHWYCFCKSN